jgi:hypothetical protein
MAASIVCRLALVKSFLRFFWPAPETADYPGRQFVVTPNSSFATGSMALGIQNVSVASLSLECCFDLIAIAISYEHNS